MLKPITYKNIPCWYELSWDEKIPAIILRIHKEFIENLRIDLQNHYMARSLMEKFKFSEFASDFNGDVGFNKVFKRQGERDNFIEFLIKIPSSEKGIKEVCYSCKGSGKDKYSGEECFFCDGTGQKFIRDWSQAYTVSASFTFFSAFLQFPEKETSASFSQLMTIQTITAREMHGGSLSGEVSFLFKRWLMSLGDDDVELPEVNNAMQIAYKKMYELTDYERHSFYALKRGIGRFITSCPGNACGLNPENWYDDQDKGYHFSCHNVDTSLQQITLLTGLAKLHDMARREIK